MRDTLTLSFLLQCIGYEIFVVGYTCAEQFLARGSTCRAIIARFLWNSYPYRKRVTYPTLSPSSRGYLFVAVVFTYSSPCSVFRSIDLSFYIVS